MIKIIAFCCLLLSNSALFSQKGSPADVDFNKYYNQLSKTKPDSILVLYTGSYNKDLKVIPETLEIICLSLKDGIYHVLKFTNTHPTKRFPSFECNIFGLFKSYEPLLKNFDVSGKSIKESHREIYRKLEITDFEIITVRSKGFEGFYKIFDKQYNFYGRKIDTTFLYPKYKDLITSVKTLIK